MYVCFTSTYEQEDYPGIDDSQDNDELLFDYLGIDDPVATFHSAVQNFCDRHNIELSIGEVIYNIPYEHWICYKLYPVWLPTPTCYPVKRLFTPRKV